MNCSRLIPWEVWVDGRFMSVIQAKNRRIAEFEAKLLYGASAEIWIRVYVAVSYPNSSNNLHDPHPFTTPTR